jgi:peptidylprolyl isomerase
MAPAKLNDTVKVHYTGKLGDGTIFDSSIEREPLEFKLGEGRVIPGFEEAVTGMSQGEAKTVTIPAEEAYGPYRDDLIMSVDLSQFPPHIEPHIGQQLQVQQQGGQTMVVKVAEVAADHVKLDANHPLAGQDLTFDIQLMEIV